MSSMTRWLDVEVGTDDIGLDTLPQNLALLDLHNDNEFKLLVGDFGRGEDGPKLKVRSTKSLMLCTRPQVKDMYILTCLLQNPS